MDNSGLKQHQRMARGEKVPQGKDADDNFGTVSLAAGDRKHPDLDGRRATQKKTVAESDRCSPNSNGACLRQANPDHGPY